MTQPPVFKRAPRPEGKGETAAPSGTSRLNKRMAELRMCSRREADAWIEQGWVRVNGQVAGTDVDGDTLTGSVKAGAFGTFPMNGTRKG